MSRMVSLLRGVNVGGRNRVPMAELAKLHVALGCRSVKTLLNSGNVVFSSDSAAKTLAPRLERALEEQFGFAVDVIVRTATQLRKAVTDLPKAFSDVLADESRLLIHFLAGRPAEIAWDGPERIHAESDRIYVYYPDGQGRSRLDIEKLAKVRATARNLRTVRALIALAEAEAEG